MKRALKHGSYLVPTFSFGELSLFSNMLLNPKGSFVRNLQEKICDKITWPFPILFSGRGIFQYSFGLLPKRHPITVVGKLIPIIEITKGDKHMEDQYTYYACFYIAVGKPISVLQTDHPTQELIDSTHEAYVQALKELYEEYNPVYGDPKVPLHFI